MGEVKATLFLDRSPLSLSQVEPPSLAPGARFKLCGPASRRVANGWSEHHWLGAQPGGGHTLSPRFAFDTAATFVVNAAPAGKPADAAAAARLLGLDTSDATPMSLSVDLGDGELIPFERFIGYPHVTAVHVQKTFGDDVCGVKRWQLTFLCRHCFDEQPTRHSGLTTTTGRTARGPLHVLVDRLKEFEIEEDGWIYHQEPPFEQNKSPLAHEAFDIALLEPPPASQRVKRESA